MGVKSLMKAAMAEDEIGCMLRSHLIIKHINPYKKQFRHACIYHQTYDTARILTGQTNRYIQAIPKGDLVTNLIIIRTQS